MLLDILNEDNSIEINLKAIQTFGLVNASYLTILIAIYKKATRKNKLIDDNYFKISRNFINNTLNLSTEEQLVCDSNLIKIGILKRKEDDPDIISLDIKMYLALLSNEDVKLENNIKEQMKIKRPKDLKQTQRQQTINALKNSIECSNNELLMALRDWVDGVYAKPNGFLSKVAIKSFQNDLNNYTKGDLDLALKVVQIATIQGYKTCQWAINTYENNIPRKSSIRVTNQKIATKNDLSDIGF